MRNIKTIIMVLLFLKTITLNAQELKISGLIKDSLTGLPLQNASATIHSIDTSLFSKTVLTDKDGLFKLSLPKQGLYTIYTTFIAYNTQFKDTVFFDESHLNAPIILMSPDNVGLKEVVISSKKPFIEMGTNKITLNVAQSPVAAGSNAYDVIKKAPGVIEQNDNLTFRGKSARILINGRPSNLSGEDLKLMLTNMQVNTIEKIEILPNPSAKYEAQGGSVINIILTKNKLFGSNYVLTTGLGTGRFISENLGLDANYRNKNMNLYGGYSYARNQQYYQTNSVRYLTQSQISSNEYDLRKRNNNGYKLGLDYDINDKSSFGFLLNGYVNDRDRKVNNSAVLHYDKNLSDSSSTVHTVGNAITSSPSLNIYYKTRLDTSGKELSLNADYMYYGKQWEDNFTNQYIDAKGQQYMQPDYLKDNSPAKIKVYALAADYVQPTKKGSLEMGVKNTYTITDNDVFWQNNNGAEWLTDKGKTNHFIYKENVNAVYGNYTAALKKWNVEAGLRVEQTNTIGKSITTNQTDKKSYFNWFPTLSLGFTKNQDNVFGFSYRKSIERFGFDFINPFITYQNQFAYTQGNPYLQPQLNHQFSLSYNYKQYIVAGIDYLHCTKALGVRFISENNTTITTYDNFQGVDAVYGYINYSKTFFTIWQLNANVSAGYFKFNINTTNTGTPPNKKPFFGFNANNNFNFKKGWSAECGVNYSGSIVTGIFSVAPVYSADIGISKTVKKIILKLSVSDILNTQKTKLYVNYQQVNLDKTVKDETRFINFVLKYSFGNKNVRSKKFRESKVSDINNRINK